MAEAQGVHIDTGDMLSICTIKTITKIDPYIDKITKISELLKIIARGHCEWTIKLHSHILKLLSPYTND